MNLYTFFKFIIQNSSIYKNRVNRDSIFSIKIQKLYARNMNYILFFQQNTTNVLLNLCASVVIFYLFIFYLFLLISSHCRLLLLLLHLHLTFLSCFIYLSSFQIVVRLVLIYFRLLLFLLLLPLPLHLFFLLFYLSHYSV